ncbi:porin [Shewanella algae]|uniref:OprD family outer membrane porin n=1 Tax=Shewanella algae TaxID=38313 RepID=UPI0011A31DE0|nr:OprD family outer membrane porin [Shewanella algae]TWO83318.1 porin [Shewanella algae]
MMKKNYLSIALFVALTMPAMADTTVDEMFTQGSLTGQLRMFDFSRDFDGTTKTKHDTSFGGLFYYRTAEVNGITLGGSFASANRVLPDENQDVYGLLANENGEHTSVNRMQEYFIQTNWWNTKVTIGAQELRTPMMNPHDIRAIKRSFRGVSAINNSFDNLTLTALYITDSMGWSDQNFVSVSQAVQGELTRAGITADVADNPVYALGATYKLPTANLSIVADLWHYNMPDVFGQIYAKLKFTVPVGDAELYLTPSYLKQDSIGDETGGSLDTYQWGSHAGIKYAGADLTLFYTKTGDQGILAPWGDEKVVIQQVYQSTQSNEEVYAARINYDFSKVGAEGLSAYVFYGDYDVPKGKGRSFSELDLSATYKLDSILKGLSSRIRYAIVDFESGEDLTDLRLYLTYDFKL